MEEPCIPWGGSDVTVCLGNEQVNQHCKVFLEAAVSPERGLLRFTHSGTSEQKRCK